MLGEKVEVEFSYYATTKSMFILPAVVAHNESMLSLFLEDLEPKTL